MNVVRVAESRSLFASGVARTIRLEAGLSQAEMAAALGVVRSTYCLWESGRRSPRSAAALRALATLELIRVRAKTRAA